MTNQLDRTGVLNTIRQAQGQLNPALKRIANYVLKHPDIVKTQSIKDLAEVCEVSESTITRFVQALEVPSYQQLKIGIAEALSTHGQAAPAAHEAFVYDDISASDTNAQIIKKILFRNISALQDTAQRLDLRLLDKVAAAIDKADSLAFFAMGSSTLAAENAVMRFMRVGKRCIFYKDQGVQQISAATLGKSSVAFAISNSGRTIPVVEALRTAQKRGATTVAITSYPDSPLAQSAHMTLLTNTTDAAVGSAPYHEAMLSKMAQLLVTDVVYSRYAVKHVDKSIAAIKDTNTVTEGSRYR